MGPGGDGRLLPRARKKQTLVSVDEFLAFHDLPNLFECACDIAFRKANLT
jgi:hypothetical protein